MNLPYRSLRSKLILSIVGGMLAASTLFLGLFVLLYQIDLERAQGDASTQVNSLLQAALENAMLKRDLDGLRGIVDRLGDQDGIVGAMIVNPSGEVRFASERARLHQTFDRDVAPTCVACHQTGRPAERSTKFMQDEAGRAVLRSVNPVSNKEPCTACHGPVELNPVNGVLFVDYDAATIRAKAVSAAMLMAGSGGLVVLLTVVGLWFLLDRLVLRRVAELSDASQAIAEGRLEHRVGAKGTDELAQLGRTFNHMADQLGQRIEEIREKEVFLQELVDAVPDGIRVVDPGTYQIVLANRAYAEQLGCTVDQAVGVACHRSSHGRDKPCPATLVTCPVAELKAGAGPVKSVHQHVRSDGEVVHVECHAASMTSRQQGLDRPLIVESLRDLAEDVRFSREQRLSAVGQLATGVAHEIRNPLASVRIALQGVLRRGKNRLPGPEELQEILDYMQLVDDQIDKCISVTERLLRLSSSPSDQGQLVSVVDAVAETVSLLAYEAEQDGVTIKIHADKSGEARIIATEGDLRMLILNLVQNAFHAMPDGGSLDITVAEDPAWVRLDVADTGRGIAPDQLVRIFDPFFSRRADGQSGTGLGLTICRGIVDALGGQIDVTSKLGEGSRFTVRLPRAGREGFAHG